jgi:endoglucanase
MNHFMSRYSIKTKLLFAALFAIAFSSVQKVSAQTLTAKYNTSMVANSGGYYEYLPEGYNSTTEKYPLLIFIHGIYEKGDGSTSKLPLILKFGLPKNINLGYFPKSFNVDGKVQRFIVIAPQFKAWPSNADINGVITYCLNKYRANSAKVYLTGLSMGGAVCWKFAANTTYNKRITAIVPICGAAGPTSAQAAAIADAGVKAWGTHNAYDNVVPASYTKNWVSYMKTKNANNPAKSSIFSSSGHDAWSRTYNASYREDGKNVFEWILQFSRGTTTPSPTPTNQVPVANAGPDKTITLPTNSVALSGSATDADGSIARYSWTKVAGPASFTFSNAAIASPTVSGLLAGTYTFRLTVSDNAGATAYNDVNVVVNTTTVSTNVPVVPGKVEAENYTTMLGVQKETTTDAGGGQNLGYINLNDWIEYKVNATTGGTYTISFRVASGTTGAQFQVRNSSGTALATVNVPNTTGFQVWKDITASVKLVAGIQTLRLHSTNSASWNFNYMNFTTGTTGTITPSVTRIEAENFSSMYGVQTETTTDAGGGQNVGYIDINDWLKYTINPSVSGTYTFTFRVASGATGAQFKVKNSSGTVLATVNVPNTGGYQTWKDVTASINLPAGSQTITLSSTAIPRWNINYFTFSVSGSVTANALGDESLAVVNDEVSATATGVAVVPNPFTDRFVLRVSNTLTGLMNVQLIDPSGVVRKSFKVTKGAAGTVQTYLSAGTLPAGNYFIKVQIGTWTETKQAVKL